MGVEQTCTELITAKNSKSRINHMIYTALSFLYSYTKLDR